MEKFYEILQKKPFGQKCFRHRYEIFHGFCAGRANYEDPQNGKLAREVRFPSLDLRVPFLFSARLIFEITDILDRRTKTSAISSMALWLEMCL